MTRGLWVVIGILLLLGLLSWVYERDFLKDNAWDRGTITEADEVTRKVDFLGLQVVRYVSRSIGGVFGGLVVVFVYLAVRQHRLERRIADLERMSASRDRQ